MYDVNGRKYATIADTKVGDRVEVDNDFTCIDGGTVLVVRCDKYGLYIPCRDGGHNLDGQVDDDYTHYVGIYPA